MDLFEDFLRKYPPADSLRKPAASQLEQYRGILPNALLEFWREYGFGNYGDGLLKVIDPAGYRNSLSRWLGGENLNRLPILMTAFGDLLYYRKLSETEDDVCLLDIHYRRIITCSYSFAGLFTDFVADDAVRAELLRAELFHEAAEAEGPLEENEIFFFAPALALGGSETVNCISKGDAAAHHQLLFEMGAST